MADFLWSLVDFWPVAIGLALMLAPVRWRRWPIIIILVMLAVTVAGMRLGWLSRYAVRMEALICITAILAVSLNLINGMTGLFSIGKAEDARLSGAPRLLATVRLTRGTSASLC